MGFRSLPVHCPPGRRRRRGRPGTVTLSWPTHTTQSFDRANGGRLDLGAFGRQGRRQCAGDQPRKGAKMLIYNEKTGSEGGVRDRQAAHIGLAAPLRAWAVRPSCTTLARPAAYCWTATVDGCPVDQGPVA